MFDPNGQPIMIYPQGPPQPLMPIQPLAPAYDMYGNPVAQGYQPPAGMPTYDQYGMMICPVDPATNMPQMPPMLDYNGNPIQIPPPTTTTTTTTTIIYQ